MTEVLTKLRLELVDELRNLPETLQSEFPDIAVDFLASVFKDSLDKEITRIPKTTKAAATDKNTNDAAPSDTASDPPPPPTDKQLAIAQARIDALQKEADRLQASAAPKLSSFGDLITPVDTKKLVRCKRCRKVMFTSVTALHAAQCKEIPPRLIPNEPASYTTFGGASDMTVGTKRTAGTTAKNGAANNSKRKKLNNSKDASGSVGPRLHDIEIPNSPTVALRNAAKHRQKRTDGTRVKRNELSFLPGKDGEGPFVLNPQTAAGLPPAHAAAVAAAMARGMPQMVGTTAAAGNRAGRAPTQYRQGGATGQQRGTMSASPNGAVLMMPLNDLKTPPGWNSNAPNGAGLPHPMLQRISQQLGQQQQHQQQARQMEQLRRQFQQHTQQQRMVSHQQLQQTPPQQGMLGVPTLSPAAAYGRQGQQQQQLQGVGANNRPLAGNAQSPVQMQAVQMANGQWMQVPTQTLQQLLLQQQQRRQAAASRGGNTSNGGGVTGTNGITPQQMLQVMGPNQVLVQDRTGNFHFSSVQR